MILSNYCIIYDYDREHCLLFSTKKAASIRIPKAMLKDIEEGSISDEERTTLAEIGLLVDDPAAEREEMIRFLDELNSINTVFRATLVMNLDCNLACSYCFEGTRKGPYFMTRETADNLIAFIKAALTPTEKELRVTFYGGEPLLSIERVMYLSEGLMTLARERGLRYSSSLITNGTLLTPSVVKRLTPLGLKTAVVTLDGPQNTHNHCRPFKGGSGSFSTIIRNLKDVRDLVDIQIGGNYMKENFKEFPVLLDLLADAGLTPEKVSSVLFDPVTNEREGVAPPDFHGGCSSINEPWLVEASIFLREEVLRKGYRTQKVVPVRCMMETDAAVVVNYDGSLYKCPGMLGRRDFRVGDVTGGMIDCEESHSLAAWKNDECLACRYLPLCFGGCRYVKFIRDGDMNGVDCKKPYFDAALESLVKQDMRFASPDNGLL